MRVGLSTTAIFGDLSGYLFGKFRCQQYYMAICYCYPLSAYDCKMNDLEYILTFLFTGRDAAFTVNSVKIDITQ